MKFSEIIGQRAVVSRLKSAIKKDMVNHAYVFDGPQGIGKNTTANIFAAALLCEGADDGQACGQCGGCIKSKARCHPDIKTIGLDLQSGGGADSSSIGVDSIRYMQKDMYIRPLLSDRKVYIISHADKLTIQAQNALLKILEEPPPYAVIILVSSNSLLLLPTILSRVVFIRFRLNSYADVCQYLGQNYTLSEQETEFIYSFSGGIMGRAKSMADSDIRVIREGITQVMMKLLDKNSSQTMSDTSFFAQHKASIDTAMNFLLYWLRDVVLIKMTANPEPINSDIKETLQKFSESVTERGAFDMLEATLDTVKKLNANANFSMAIELMLIRFLYARSLK